MLARWIISTHPAELHVRHLQRDVRLQGLRTAEQIRAAAGVLVEADWLREPEPGTEFGQRGRIAYAVNPDCARQQNELLPHRRILSTVQGRNFGKLIVKLGDDPSR
jgi:hypothetical protein